MARHRYPGTLCPRAVLGYLDDMLQVIHVGQLVLLLLILKGASAYSDDRCDTVVWDLGGHDVGVRDVTGSCSEGRVDWRNPYGAIRVTLQLRPIRLQKHVVPVAFESCFTVSARSTSVKIFYDDTRSPTLAPLAALNSSHSGMPKELCFVSEGAPIVLYIESELDGYSAAFGHLQLEYDNRRLPVVPNANNMDECRPCSEDEIVEAVCTNDFVVTGSMKDVLHSEELQQTNLHINVNEVFRQRHNIFPDRRKADSRQVSRSRKYPRLNIQTENGIVEWPPNEAGPSFSDNEPNQSRGVIFAPHKCGIRKGAGDFLFIGRVRLKKAILRCAPRLEDFNRIWALATKMEKNMCLLR